MGCKGPVAYNACATVKWNGSTSFPIQSGHGCIGCSEPDFWDRGGFYRPLSAGTSSKTGMYVGGAAAAGALAGLVAATVARKRKSVAMAQPAAQEAESKEG